MRTPPRASNMAAASTSANCPRSSSVKNAPNRVRSFRIANASSTVPFVRSTRERRTHVGSNVLYRLSPRRSTCVSRTSSWLTVITSRQRASAKFQRNASTIRATSTAKKNVTGQAPARKNKAPEIALDTTIAAIRIMNAGRLNDRCGESVASKGNCGWRGIGSVLMVGTITERVRDAR